MAYTPPMPRGARDTRTHGLPSLGLFSHNAESHRLLTDYTNIPLLSLIGSGVDYRDFTFIKTKMICPLAFQRCWMADMHRRAAGNAPCLACTHIRRKADDFKDSLYGAETLEQETNFNGFVVPPPRVQKAEKRVLGGEEVRDA